MFRLRLGTLLGIGLMLAAASTNARELEISAEMDIGGESNVFNRTDDEIDDGTYEFRPGVALREQREELNYDFSYKPSYTGYFDTDGIDGWDHRAFGELSWRATPRDTLGFTQSYTYRRQVGQNDTDDQFLSDPNVFEFTDRQRVQSVRSSAFYSHAFTERWSGSLSASFDDFDYSTGGNTDNRSYGGAASTNYAVDDLTRVGISASGRYREFLGVGFQASSSSTVTNVSLSIERQLTPTISFSAQGGPSIIESKQDDLSGASVLRYRTVQRGGSPAVAVIDAGGTNCGPRTLLNACDTSTLFPPINQSIVSLDAPANGDGESTDDVSFFATVNLEKTWEQGRLGFEYSRQESGATGNGASTIVDRVAAVLLHRFLRTWTVTVRGAWSQQEVIGDPRASAVVASPDFTLPVGGGNFVAQSNSLTFVEANGNNEDREQWNFSTRLGKQVTENLQVSGRFTYLNQRRDGIAGSRTLENYTGFISFKYVFDPFLF